MYDFLLVRHCNYYSSTLYQSCSWVGLTRGLGWVGPGMGRKFVFLVGWVGSWVWNGTCAKNTRRVESVELIRWWLRAGLMTVMLVIMWVFALLRCALGWWWWHDVHKLIFLRQASCCSMYGGSVGYGLGWVDENRPTDNSALYHIRIIWRWIMSWPWNLA